MRMNVMRHRNVGRLAWGLSALFVVASILFALI
jgi:hypothetical protein